MKDMPEFIWRDGGEYNLAGLRRAVSDFGEKRLLAPLSQGQAPDWLPLDGKLLKNFKSAHEKVKDPEFRNTEISYCFHTLTQLLTFFNRAHYDSPGLNGGARYAVRFGLLCARLIDAVVIDDSLPDLRKPETVTHTDTYMRRVLEARGEDTSIVEKGRDKSSLKGLKVLVANDDPNICNLLACILKMKGAEVIEAYDGAEAYDLAWRRNPDIILLNFRMPKMDGLETCKKLKDNPRTWNIPVLLESALHEADFMEEAVRSGASDWIFGSALNLNPTRLARSISYIHTCESLQRASFSGEEVIKIMGDNESEKKIEQCIKDSDMSDEEKFRQIHHIIDNKPDFSERVMLRNKFREPILMLAKRILKSQGYLPQEDKSEGSSQAGEDAETLKSDYAGLSDEEKLRKYYGGNCLSEEQISNMQRASNRANPELDARSRKLVEGMFRDTARQHSKEFEEQTDKFIAINSQLLSVCDEINKKMTSINALVSELKGMFDPDVAARINAGLADYEKLRKEMDALLQGENVKAIIDTGDAAALATYCAKLTACAEKAEKALETIAKIHKLALKSH